MVNDTIADALARIRNAVLRRQTNVTLKHTKLVERIVSILADQGFVKSFEVVDSTEDSISKEALESGFGKTISVELNYVEEEGKKKINSLKRISKPGLRIYRGYRELQPVLNNYGISILSTPKGVLTNVEARKQRVGGEVICEVY